MHCLSGIAPNGRQGVLLHLAQQSLPGYAGGMIDRPSPADTIRAELARANLSATDAARLIGVNRSALARVLSGGSPVTLDMAHRIGALVSDAAGRRIIRAIRQAEDAEGGAIRDRYCADIARRRQGAAGTEAASR